MENYVIDHPKRFEEDRRYIESGEPLVGYEFYFEVLREHKDSVRISENMYIEGNFPSHFTAVVTGINSPYLDISDARGFEYSELGRGKYTLKTVEDYESFIKNNLDVDGKELNVLDLSVSDIVKIVKEKKLESVNLINRFVTRSHIAKLARIPTLKSVMLLDKGIEALPLIESKTLTSLSLSYSTVTFEIMNALSRNTTLISLVLSDSELSDIKMLSGNTKLLHLKMSGNDIRGDLGKIGQFPSLISLDLSNNDIRVQSIDNMPKLTSLKLSDNGLDNDDAISLAKSRTLTLLDVSYNKIGDIGAIALSMNTRITTLDLSHNLLTNRSIKLFAKTNTLTSLGLSYSKVFPSVLSLLASNPKLVSLNLAHNKIGDDGAAVLSSFSELSSLDLSNNELTDHGASSLANSRTLTSLNLSNNNIGNNGAVSLARNTILSFLNLSKNKITDEGAREFLNNNTVNSLNFERNKIKHCVIRELLEHIPSLSFDNPSYFDRLIQARNRILLRMTIKQQLDKYIPISDVQDILHGYL